MKFLIDRPLRFWVNVAYEDIKSDHVNCTKQQLFAHILREYESRGDAMRYLNVKGKIAWKPSPMMLMELAGAEREAEEELADFP